MTRTAGAPIGCQRPSRFWGLGCPKIYHEAEDTLVVVGYPVQQQRKATGNAYLVSNHGLPRAFHRVFQIGQPVGA
ncbi:hypothetical protein, partial [Thiolapillus sp.]|uniref:hypothetical protein n=1 Tax=Thiolapillus sp. TaxID=2017437 RepID=UPI003AF887CB